MTNEHTSLEKYTSHTLFSIGLRKGCYWLCVRGELETEQTATYWPQVPLTIAALISHSTGLLNWGSLKATSPQSGAGSHYLELQLELQLTQAVCGTWLYNCLTFTCFLWASRLHRIQPVHRSRRYPDIFDRMHLFFDWRLGRGPICYSQMTEGFEKFRKNSLKCYQLAQNRWSDRTSTLHLWPRQLLASTSRLSVWRK